MGTITLNRDMAGLQAVFNEISRLLVLKEYLPVCDICPCAPQLEEQIMAKAKAV